MGRVLTGKLSRNIQIRRIAILVLSRHVDEVIVIGKDIRITVVDIRGDKVRIGVDAPKNVPVHRLEVYESIQKKENND